MFEDNKIFIKICGLTTPKEAAACAGLGADAIGMIFHEKSPRHLSIKEAKRVSRALPESVTAVGVFVDKDDDYILKRVRACGLGAIQLHGKESPAQIKRLADLGIRVIKTLFAAHAPRFDQAKNYPEAAAFLAERGKGKLPGGNAETWNWETAKELGENHPLILAGGLSPNNVEKAMAMAHPCGVDISSRVELEPGKKDLTLVKAFIQSAQRGYINRDRRQKK